jgi:hypothetical protein
MRIGKVVVLLIAVIVVSLSVNLQGCQAVSAPEKTTELYQSFLTDVLGVDLTRYDITNPGYGTSYPSSFGGKVKEETISYQLISGQGNLSTWCLIHDGVLTSCDVNHLAGQTGYSYPVNIKDSFYSFMQKYQTLVEQYYQKDSAYLKQALSMVEGLDFQTETQKTVGDMKLTVTITPYNTRVKWAYNYESVGLVRKSISLEFTNGTASGFADTWNMYSIYNQTSISKEEAQSIAFAAAKSKAITIFSSQNGNPAPSQVTPDWTNWTCKADLNLIPGASSSQAIGLANDTSFNSGRDPLMLYPMWHFVFYFNTPIGNVLGVEVGVWTDNGEVAYSNAYGGLGPSMTNTPEPTGADQSASPETTATASPNLHNETNNDSFPTRLECLIVAIAGVAVAIAVASLVILRKKGRNVDQRLG